MAVVVCAAILAGVMLRRKKTCSPVSEPEAQDVSNSTSLDKIEESTNRESSWLGDTEDFMMRRGWIIFGSLFFLLTSTPGYGQVIKARIGMEGIS